MRRRVHCFAHCLRFAPSLELSPAVLSEATADVGTAAETSETTDKSPQSRSLISNLIWHSKGRRSYKLPRGTSSSPAGDATRTKSRFSLQAWASTSNSTAASDTVVVDAVIDASHDDPLGSSNGNGNGIQSPPPSSVRQHPLWLPKQLVGRAAHRRSLARHLPSAPTRRQKLGRHGRRYHPHSCHTRRRRSIE